eukprot:GGOE01017954.1.p1 GENE.GGOE01017954.1~~GGOE01017954.1.p1  ORF type:complete len:1070 (+),score=220.13 GGOE01017954.1:123-3332(+)
MDGAGDSASANGIAAVEAVERAGLQEAEHAALGLIVALTRLVGTELVLRGKLQRQAIQPYRLARKQLLLGIQHLVHRDLLVAQEGLERLEVDDRWDLASLETEGRRCLLLVADEEQGICGMLQLLSEEAVSRITIELQEDTRALEVELAAEPLWRRQCESDECAGYERINASWSVQQWEREGREAMELEECAARPDPAPVELQLLHARGRGALRAMQVLQRQEMAQRWKLLKAELAVATQYRQQCIFAAVAWGLEDLRKQQQQQRRLMLASEKTQRAFLTAQRVVVQQWQTGAAATQCAEAVDYAWLIQRHQCVTQWHSGRTHVSREEDQSYAQLLLHALDSGARCSKRDLEAEEAEGREALCSAWKEDWQFLFDRLESCLREEVMARYTITASRVAYEFLNGAEQRELQARHTVALGALCALRGVAEHTVHRLAVWREMEVERKHIRMAREAEVASLRSSEWVVREPLRRSLLQERCLQLLRLVHAHSLTERLEYTSRRGIRIEEGRQARDLQAWLGLTTPLELQQTTARSTILGAEDTEWRALFSGAMIDRKMAKLTMEMRTGKEERLQLLKASHKSTSRSKARQSGGQRQQRAGSHVSVDAPLPSAGAKMPNSARAPDAATDLRPVPGRQSSSAAAPSKDAPLPQPQLEPTLPEPGATPQSAAPHTPPQPALPPQLSAHSTPKPHSLCGSLGLVDTPRTRLRAASLSKPIPVPTTAIGGLPPNPPPPQTSASAPASPTAAPGTSLTPLIPTAASEDTPLTTPASTDSAADEPLAPSPPPQVDGRHAGLAVSPAVLGPATPQVALAIPIAGTLPDMDDLVANALRLLAAGQGVEARRCLAEAVHWATRLPLGSFEENRTRLASLGDALNNIGCLDWRLGELAAADDSLRLAAVAQQQAYGRPLPSTLVNRCYVCLAGAGDADAAILHATSAIEVLDDDLAAPSNVVPEPGRPPQALLPEVQVYAWLGLGLAQQSASTQEIRSGAEGSLATAVEVGHRSLGPDHPATQYALQTFHQFLVAGAHPPAPRQAWGSQRRVPGALQEQRQTTQRKTRVRPQSGPSRTRLPGS